MSQSCNECGDQTYVQPCRMCSSMAELCSPRKVEPFVPVGYVDENDFLKQQLKDSRTANKAARLVIEELKLYSASLLKDANRYRWLRSVGKSQQNVIGHYAMEAMDKIIDDSMSKDKDDLKDLLNSVLGNCYLGKEREEELATKLLNKEI